MANQQKKLSQLERALRLATVWSFWPALGLSIPSSVFTRDPTLGLLLIPMAGSLILAIYVLAGKKLPMRDILHWSVPLIDAALAAALIGGLVPFWIFNQIHSYWNGRWTMLSTYASVPMMFNFAVHLFFVLRGFKHALDFISGIFSASTCPHCQHSLRASDFTLPSEVGSHRGSPKTLYAAVPFRDADDAPAISPRQAMAEVDRTPPESCDDESACLV